MNRSETPQRVEITIGYLDEEGRLIEEELLQYVEAEMVMEATGGEFTAFHAIPFNWVGFFEPGRDGIFYVGRSDSLRVEGFDRQGQNVLTISNRVRPRPVTNEDIEANGISRNSPAYSRIPDHHPAFRTFKADEDGRIWFNLGEADEDGSHTWVLLDSGGEPVQALRLSSRLSGHVFRDGKVYGVYREEDGRQNVYVYRIP